MKDELSHHLYVLLRAADRFHTHFGSFPGSQEASLSESAKYKELCGTVCAEVNPLARSIRKLRLQSFVRVFPQSKFRGFHLFGSQIGVSAASLGEEMTQVRLLTSADAVKKKHYILARA